MQNTTYIALARQAALRRQMDMVANNIANVNTTGFKGEAPLFTDYLIDVPTKDRAFGDKVAYVQDLGTVRDYSEGQMRQTGNPLDVAIHGNGYFMVETPDGEFYTRNGQFKLNEDGQLVTSTGDAVLSDARQPIFFAPTETDINIAQDGSVSTENGIVAKLGIVNFEDQQALRKTHSGLYKTTDDNQPENVTDVTVAQGMLEGSNVQSIVEMTRLIEIHRSYSNVQKMIDVESDRISRAVNEISRRPAG